MVTFSLKPSMTDGFPPLNCFGAGYFIAATERNLWERTQKQTHVDTAILFSTRWHGRKNTFLNVGKRKTEATEIRSEQSLKPGDFPALTGRHGNTLKHTGTGSDYFFLKRPPVALQIRVRTDKWDNGKLKSFCTTKEAISAMKLSLTTHGENIQLSIWQRISIQKIQRTRDPTDKWASQLNRDISKEEILMSGRHRKTCPASLTIGKKL